MGLGLGLKLNWIPGYYIWWDFFRTTPTDYEIICKILPKIRKLMENGASNRDIRNWLITTQNNYVTRVWIRNKPVRRITIVINDKYYGFVIERKSDKKFIELIPIL